MDFFKNVQTRMTSNYIRLIDIEQIKQEPMELFNNIKLVFPDIPSYNSLKD